MYNVHVCIIKTPYFGLTLAPVGCTLRAVKSVNHVPEGAASCLSLIVYSIVSSSTLSNTTALEKGEGKGGREGGRRKGRENMYVYAIIVHVPLFTCSIYETSNTRA